MKTATQPKPKKPKKAPAPAVAPAVAVTTSTLTLNSEDIRRAAALFRRLGTRPTTLPIIDCILFTVRPGEAEATMEVTDLDIGLTVRANFGFPTTPGTFTLPKRDFFAIAKSADRQSAVRFDSGAKHTTAAIVWSKSMRTELKIIGLPPDEFPITPALDSPPVMMSAASLAAIRKVHAAASTDETRYVLNGVLISRVQGGVVVATDGKRLAMMDTPIHTPDCILPSKLIHLLQDPACQSAALWRNNEDAEVISLTFGQTTLTSKVILGNYPNFRQVIPDSHTGSATFPPAVLPDITAWLRNYPKETVRLTFDAASNTVTFEVNRPDKGHFSTTARAAHDGTVPESCAYNASFLADALAMGLATMDLTDERSPATLTDGPTRYILMPMRLSDGDVPVTAAPPAEVEDPTDPTDPTDEVHEVVVMPPDEPDPGIEQTAMFGPPEPPTPKPLTDEDAIEEAQMDADERESNVVAIANDPQLWRQALTHAERTEFTRLRRVSLPTLSARDRARFQALEAKIFKHAEIRNAEEEREYAAEA